MFFSFDGVLVVQINVVSSLTKHSTNSSSKLSLSASKVSVSISVKKRRDKNDGKIESII